MSPNYWTMGGKVHFLSHWDVSECGTNTVGKTLCGRWLTGLKRAYTGLSCGPCIGKKAVRRKAAPEK